MGHGSSADLHLGIRLQQTSVSVGPTEWSSVRLAVLERDDNSCVACGEACSGSEAHVHHLIPRSAGGSDDAGNLITLCAACHAVHHPNLQVGLARRAIIRFAFTLARFLDHARELDSFDESLEIVLRLLGVERLRPAQLEVIQAALRGESVLFVSATGSGKTLCFQVPVLLRDGCAYVVSPLKALMREQLSDLQRKKIPATFINSDLSPVEKKLRYQLLHRKVFRFLLCTPERFDSQRVREAELRALTEAKPRWLVVDEAHCIDRWGEDFRPSYGRLGEVRELLGRPQILAFTATAGKASQKRILKSLGVPDARVVVTGVDRPNIALARISLDLKDKHRLALIKELIESAGPGRTMIFVPSRKIGHAVKLGLQGMGISIPFYHSRLGTSNERDLILGRFTGRIQPSLNAVICTNAFGMGLDVPDVRVVVHWQPPASVEDYLQEFGRAGRDGKPAVAVLFTSRHDEALPRFMAEKTVESAELAASQREAVLQAKYEAIDKIMSIANARRECFRRAIGDYFGAEDIQPPKSLARRLIEWVFTRETRVLRAKGCCDRCDKVAVTNLVSWATLVLRNETRAGPKF